MAFTLQTFDEYNATTGDPDQTLQEIVLSEVTNIVSRRRPLMANLDQVSVNTTHVEMLTDSYEARGDNATVEGIAFTDQELSQPVRHFVTVQSFYKSGQVSDEQRLVAHYTSDPLSYQVQKRMDACMNDVEHALHRGSNATGATNAARRLQGLLNAVTATAVSGTSLTEEIMIDHLQTFRDSSLDVVPTQAYVGSGLKRTISAMSTQVTRNVDVARRLQVLTIERHTSDFGDLDVIYSEDQLNSAKGAVGASIVYLDPTFFQVGWLRRPMVEQLSRDGLRDRFQINMQCTLMYRTTQAGFAVTDLTPTY